MKDLDLQVTRSSPVWRALLGDVFVCVSSSHKQGQLSFQLQAVHLNLQTSSMMSEMLTVSILLLLGSKVLTC